VQRHAALTACLFRGAADNGGMDEEIRLLVEEAVGRNGGLAWDLSNFLAAHPETAFREFGSSRKIAGVLKDAGFRTEYPYSGLETAFRAVFDNGDGPAVGILTEYDALPEIGHACGHNLHGSLSVLAALALKELAGLYRGKVVVYGTPAEEGGGGKIGLADAGAFDGLSLAMMMHSYSGGVCEPDMAALCMRSYTFTFRGKPSHAIDKPWNGHSALAAARKFLDLIDANRECFMPDMHANGIITKGGKVTNIIPHLAEVVLEFRAADLKALEGADRIITRCADGAALALGCSAERVRNNKDFNAMLRIPALEEEIAGILRSLGKRVREVSPPVGSSDVGNVSYRCPAIQPLLSVTGEDYPLHSVEFARAVLREEAREDMLTGAKALCLLALKVFRDSGFRERVLSDFAERRR